MTVRIADLNRQPDPPPLFKISKRHRQITMDTCAYVLATLDGDLSVNALATRIGYSRSHFSRMFRRIMGLPLNAYVTNARMDHAAELLRDTNLTVIAIMHRVGYESTSAFATTFRGRTGLGPREYRDRSRLDAETRRRTAQEGLQE